MNEKKSYTPEASYGTGSTHPVKSRGGMWAVVLAVVIFLGGVFSMMNLLNIRLFHKMNEAAPVITFSRQAEPDAQAEGIGNKTPMLGIRCETVGPFLENYYRLPQGVYVTQVTAGGAAQAAGLVMGDVIVTFAGTAVENVNDLASLIRARKVGDFVRITVIREGKSHCLDVILGEN